MRGKKQCFFSIAVLHFKSNTKKSNEMNLFSNDVLSTLISDVTRFLILITLLMNEFSKRIPRLQMYEADSFSFFSLLFMVEGEKYCRDLTNEAAEGKLNEVFGRDQEITRIFQILCCYNRCNPLLVGPLA